MVSKAFGFAYSAVNGFLDHSSNATTCCFFTTYSTHMLHVHRSDSKLKVIELIYGYILNGNKFNINLTNKFCKIICPFVLFGQSLTHEIFIGLVKIGTVYSRTKLNPSHTNSCMHASNTPNIDGASEQLHSYKE